MNGKRYILLGVIFFGIILYSQFAPKKLSWNEDGLRPQIERFSGVYKVCHIQDVKKINDTEYEYKATVNLTGRTADGHIEHAKGRLIYDDEGDLIRGSFIKDESAY